MSYSRQNPPKVGQLIRVSDDAWHKPYRGKVLEVLKVDYAGDIWVVGDETHRDGLCFGISTDRESYEALPVRDFRVGDLVKIEDTEMCLDWCVRESALEAVKDKTLTVSRVLDDTVNFKEETGNNYHYHYPKGALKHVPHFPLQESNNPVENQQENSEIENTEVQCAVYEADGDTILMKGTKEQVKSYLEEGMSYARLRNMLEEEAIKVVKLQEVTATLGANGVEFK